MKVVTITLTMAQLVAGGILTIMMSSFTGFIIAIKYRTAADVDRQSDKP